MKKLRIRMEALAGARVDAVRGEIEQQLVGAIMREVTLFMEELVKLLQHQLESGKQKIQSSHE